MAFEITCKDKKEAQRIRAAVRRKVVRSRFQLSWYGDTRINEYLEIETRGFKRVRLVVAIREIRLRRKKPYCGNHPGPCRINPIFERPHRWSCCLEGLDWVSWDDLINDVLDKLNHGGDAGSKFVNIRRNGERRIRYEMFEQTPGHVEWQKNPDDYDYLDCRPGSGNTAPEHSDHPEGTPGALGWRMKDQPEVPKKRRRKATAA